MSYTPRYKHGQWKAECQRCGFDYHSGQIKLEWTGLRVCSGAGTNNCWEPRPAQDFVRGVPDRQTPPWTAPPPSDVFVSGAITFTSGTTATVAENISDATTIYTAAATSGQMLTVSYEIPITGDVDDLFEIDSSTGVLTLQAGKSLSYDVATSHVVLIRATDGKFSAQQAVTVSVTDV